MRSDYWESTHHGLSLDGFVDRGTIAVFPSFHFTYPVLIPGFRRPYFEVLDYYPELSSFLLSKIASVGLALIPLAKGDFRRYYGAELYYSREIFLSLSKDSWHHSDPPGWLANLETFLEMFPWIGNGAPHAGEPGYFKQFQVLSYDLRSASRASFARAKNIVRDCIGDLPLEARTSLPRGGK